MILIFFTLLLHIQAAPLRKSPPPTSCLLPCRDAAAREKIEKDYSMDPPANENCYWRFRSGDEILTGCLRNKWIFFLGDSELRGITLSLLKQLLHNNYKWPQHDDISLESRHSAYFNVDGSFDVTKFNLGAMDFLIETDTWTGEITRVFRWSATKNSADVNKIVRNLKAGRRFMDHTPTGQQFLKLEANSINPSRHWTRVSYFFTHEITEVVSTYLKLIKPAQIRGADHLVMNGGKWDL